MSPDAVANERPVSAGSDDFSGPSPAAWARQRIARMSAWFLTSSLVQMAVVFATSVVVGRGLGITEFGHWTLLMAWASTLTVAFDLGLSALVTRDAATDHDSGGRLVAGALAMRLAIFAPVAAIIYTIAPRLVGQEVTVPAVRAVIWLAAAGLAYGCFAALFRAWPRWLSAILAIEIAGTAAQCVGAYWIIRVGVGRGRIADLLWLATAVQLLQLSAAIGLWRLAADGSPFEWPSPREGWRLVKRAFPFALVGVVSNMQSRIGPLMLGYVSSAGEIAALGVASRIGGVARIVPNAAFASAMPVLAHEVGHGEPERVQREFHAIVRWFAVAAAVVLALAARPALRIVYGDRFVSAAPVLVWIALGLLPSLVNNSRKLYLYAAGREHAAVKWTALGLGVQVAVSLALIPKFGAVGAAAAMLLSEVAIWSPLRQGATPS